MASVRPGSLAEECGLKPGDILVELAGQPVRDLVDYRFLSSATELEVVFARAGVEHEIQVHKDWDENLGLEFESSVFDRVRTCRNNCTFCFVKNLPRGLRKALYIKDDDYRLSFLYGNFITLSNVGQADFDRIAEQRLSPLFVSIHATDRGLRNRLLGVEAPDILEQLDMLGRLGVRVHAQVVLCPGINDGDALVQTILDLSARSGHVESVALVPVGLTRHCSHPALRTYRADEARDLLAAVAPIQRRLRKQLGRTLVHLSDEFYALAGAEVPGAAWYDGYPQLENGVGLVRRLLVSWALHRRSLPASVSVPRRVAWICGESAVPTLKRLAADVNAVAGLRVEVRPVINEFFGRTVTVSGLLAGVDVARDLAGDDVDQWVLPRAMFEATGTRTLDGMTLTEVRGFATARVGVAGTAEELLGLTLLESARCAA